MNRFWNKTTRVNDCLEWTGYIRKDGYANFFLDGKTLLAHRVACMLTRGEIPQGMEVCHHCDNRKCVNPDHLFLGSLKDNMQDMVKKGRNKPQRLFGESNPMAKLSITDILNIRELHEIGFSYARIACIYHVHKTQIGRIVRKENWGLVARRYSQPTPGISVADAMAAGESIKLKEE